MDATTMPNRTYTFEDVWASLMENRAQMDRMQKEYEERWEKQQKEAEKERKELNKIIGDLGNRFGELAEHMVRPKIMEKFNERGFHFSETSVDFKISIPDNPDASTEVDIMLENGDIVIAVEVKAKAKESDIDQHIKRMEILRKRADRRGDNRKYQGAIASAIMGQAVHDYILKNGFYAIEQSGDTVQINTPESFKAREW